MSTTTTLRAGTADTCRTGVEDVGAGRAVGDHDEERLSSSHWATIRSIVVSG
ncbi:MULTISPECIES: hypothetical protein [Streptomyces]|uniref:hypothetical protein n=1 Tax=Streptomyces TaxID=1883 RepID=UPI000B2D1E56|nr:MULTISPECIES: hypothetical protein [Streptomyces]